MTCYHVRLEYDATECPHCIADARILAEVDQLKKKVEQLEGELASAHCIIDEEIRRPQLTDDNGFGLSPDAPSGQALTYLVALPPGRVKVGKTSNLRLRLKSMQTTCPEARVLLWNIEIPEGVARTRLQYLLRRVEKSEVFVAEDPREAVQAFRIVVDAWLQERAEKDDIL